MNLKYINQVKANISIYSNKKSSNILDGSYKSVYRGKSMNFENLREYVINDDVKDIDWKASARSANLLVKQFNAEKKHNILIVMDTGIKMDGDTNISDSKKDVALYSAGTIGYLAIKNGDYVGMLYNQQDRITYKPFRYNLYNLEQYLTDFDKYATVENQEGIDNFEEILEASDGIMVARGDLGVEIPFQEVPIAQKNMIKACNRKGKAVITATQMLESMTHSPRPTRAEVSDVANAIYDRTGAIMLSGECAMGEYPLECVQTMDKIARRIEPTINYWKRFEQNDNIVLKNLEDNITYSTCVIAKNTKADAIVAYTHTGDSARRLAGMGAGCPILAITDNRRTFNQLGIVWNVTPVFVEKQENIDKTIESGIKKLQQKEILEKGDMIVLTGGAKMLDSVTESKIIGGIVRI